MTDDRTRDTRSVQVRSRGQATERTGLAQERTQLAGERTLTAWLRTGIASQVTGLGVAKLLGQLGAPRLTLAIGASFILVAGGIYVFAWWNYRRRRRKLNTDWTQKSRLSVWITQSMVLLLFLSAIVAFVLLFTPGISG